VTDHRRGRRSRGRTGLGHTHWAAILDAALGPEAPVFGRTDVPRVARARADLTVFRQRRASRQSVDDREGRDTGLGTDESGISRTQPRVWPGLADETNLAALLRVRFG
jgi:hypothetical protein